MDAVADGRGGKAAKNDGVDGADARARQHGNGEFRPRIPQYPEIQDYLGTAVNTVLAGGLEPQEALDEAQARALELF